MIYLNKSLSATKIVNIWNNLFINKKSSKIIEKKNINNNFKIIIFLFIFQNLKVLLQILY